MITDREKEILQKVNDVEADYYAGIIALFTTRIFPHLLVDEVVHNTVNLFNDLNNNSYNDPEVEEDTNAP